MLQKMEVVILRNIRYSDSSNVVEVYSSVAGRLSFLVRHSRSRNTASALRFQPFTCWHFEADIRGHGILHYIREASPAFPCTSVMTCFCKTSLCLFLSEFLCQLLRQEEPDEPLFAFLRHSIECLETIDETQCANFHVVFLWHLLRFLGVYPNMESYHPGCCFDLLNAECTDSAIGRSHVLSSTDTALLYQLQYSDYSNMQFLSLSHSQRQFILETLFVYYKLHFPGIADLKSYGVLQSVFS